MQEKGKVLIVEDEPSMRFALKKYLIKKGYGVESVENGFEALMVLNYLVPDVIIADIRMPKLNGITLCEALKNRPETKSIPFIFTTAYREEDVILKARELGA